MKRGWMIINQNQRISQYMRYQECYEVGKKLLEENDVVDAAIDARILLEFCCKTNRNYLYLHGEEEVKEEMVTQYLSLIRSRQQHIPLQHLTNEKEFMGWAFSVNEDVLIPWQDTEILEKEVLKQLHNGLHILDM